MPTRVLILGANGFIGRRLTAELGTAEWAVPIAGVRRRSAAFADDVEQRTVDAASDVSVGRAMAHVDAVVNCVAGDASSMTGSARAVVTAATQAGSTPRVVHLSTMSVYGDATGRLDETAPLRGNLGPYSAAKVDAEQAIAAYPHSVILRPGCVYGPESPQWSTRIARLLIARRLGDLGADGDGYCNLVHINDVVAAIVRCLKPDRLAQTVFNLSTPDPPSWNEFLIEYGRALQAVPIRRVSRRRLRIEARILAPSLKILELTQRALKLSGWRLPPPLPGSLLRLMRQEIQLDVGAAERVLGMRWTDLHRGLEDTARWYLRGGHLA